MATVKYGQRNTNIYSTVLHLNFDPMNFLCNAVNPFPTAGNLSPIAVNLLCQQVKLNYF